MRVELDAPLWKKEELKKKKNTKTQKHKNTKENNRIIKFLLEIFFEFSSASTINDILIPFKAKAIKSVAMSLSSNLYKTFSSKKKRKKIETKMNQYRQFHKSINHYQHQDVISLPVKSLLSMV